MAITTRSKSDAPKNKMTVKQVSTCKNKAKNATQKMRKSCKGYSHRQINTLNFNF